MDYIVIGRTSSYQRRTSFVFLIVLTTHETPSAAMRVKLYIIFFLYISTAAAGPCA